MLRINSRVNETQEAVKYHYGKVETGMPIFMDDIAAVGTADDIRKGIQNCRARGSNRRKSKKRNSSRSRYLQVPTTVINKLGNLKGHILELNRKCEVINREIKAIGAKHQVGKEEIRVKLKL